MWADTDVPTMKKVRIDDVANEPHRMGVNSVRRYVGDDLGMDHVAVVFYELEPGDSFSGGLHTHHDQEELFYVLEGTATFEYTLDRDEVVVEAGESVYFPPGEFQHGFNATGEPVVAIALGAPTPERAEDIEWFHECAVCDEETRHSHRPQEEDEDRLSYCLECGNEFFASAIDD